MKFRTRVLVDFPLLRVSFLFLINETIGRDRPSFPPARGAGLPSLSRFSAGNVPPFPPPIRYFPPSVPALRRPSDLPERGGFATVFFILAVVPKPSFSDGGLSHRGISPPLEFFFWMFFSRGSFPSPGAGICAPARKDQQKNPPPSLSVFFPTEEQPPPPKKTPPPPPPPPPHHPPPPHPPPTPPKQGLRKRLLLSG